MIGRLFRQNSSSSLNSDNPNPSHQLQQQLQPSGTNSYEDTYTRQILYGVSDKSILSPYDLNSKFFRILVSQDGGSLRSKQILFDSTNNTANYNTPVQPLTPKSGSPRNSLSSKIHHNPSELHDYMFGCGLPTNEHQSMTKIHYLPLVNQTKSVLVTRLFSITDFQDEEFCPVDWAAKPTLPLKETKLNTSSKNNITSRFGIGLIIPIYEEFPDIISCNWNQICHFLIILQKTVCKKLINLLTEPNGLSYIVNKRIQFPQSILSNDTDLYNNVVKLIKLVNYDSNIAKLINSNSLMKLGQQKFNPIMLNWASEILNWLEFKDESCKFLASLLGLIIPLRYQLMDSPVHYDWNLNNSSKEITRIVIMTGNPMVAKKLVFIINGLIPDSKVYNLLDSDNKIGISLGNLDLESAVDEDTDDDEKDDTERMDEIEIPDHDHDNEMAIDESPSPPSFAMPVITRPIPIRGRESFSSSENSYSTPSLKGWEIPGKSTISTSVNSSSKKIPINKSSLNRSSSMAYLSSSLNSSLSSSASNYSLSQLGGSFIEKWRNSFNNSITNGIHDNIDYHPNKTSINRKMSFQNLRTPSPAVEIEEFKLPKTNVIESYNNSKKMDMEEVHRTKNMIYSDEASDTIKSKISNIMNQPNFQITAVNEISLEVNTINSQSTKKHSEPLLPCVPFTDEFRPEFILQSCPINPRLEHQVISSMKNDLLFYQNNCDVKNITSKTILVSLRAKEIKLIELKYGDSMSPNVAESPTPSPIHSYFNDFKRNSNAYKTTIKKVFTPHKNSGDIELINMIDNHLNELNELFCDNYKIMTNDILNDKFYEELSHLVYKLIK